MTVPARSARVIDADVVVVGDGPAGSSLAQALHRRDVDVVLAGPDLGWPATYGTWADDVEAIDMLRGVDVWEHRVDSIAARFGRLRTIARPYGVISNPRLRAALRSGLTHEVVAIESPDSVRARLVVDATGWPSKLGSTAVTPDAVAWQSAFGVVVRRPPDGSLGAPMLMDYSPTSEAEGDHIDAASFAYALPVADGWLVEETVLASSPIVEPERLVARLESRLGGALDGLDVVRTETVRIPMGAPIPTDLPDRVVAYGAAAGMIHPATGYSITSSLASAGGVADAIRGALDDGADADMLARAARESVWPVPARRTRSLHDYGLDVLTDADPVRLRSFFDTFFDLPRERWAAYLRIGTPPAELAAVMSQMFLRADWPLRRTLVSSNPRPFARLLRP